VDEVERVVEDPFARAVIDQELAVGWHLLRLYRTEVGTYDVGGGMFVCEVDGPDTGTAANVEDSLHIIGDRRSIELSIQGQAEGVVLKIQPVHLDLKSRSVSNVQSRSHAWSD
jgi:hypothetical protein